MHIHHPHNLRTSSHNHPLHLPPFSWYGKLNSDDLNSMKPGKGLSYFVYFLLVLKCLDCLDWQSMTVKGGSSQACAACKYQRRRCTKDCPLAPYFPADQPKVFQNAHRLFGVSNIGKVLKKVRDDQKEEAMKSIKYESDIRERFPVYGCVGVIWHLNEQVQYCRAELHYIRSVIGHIRQSSQSNSNKTKPDHDPLLIPMQYLNLNPTSGGSNIHTNCGNFNMSSSEYEGLQNQLGVLPTIQKSTACEEIVYHGLELNPFWVQSYDHFFEGNAHERVIHRAYFGDQSKSKGQFEEDDRALDPVVANDRHSNMDQKEACGSSTESSARKDALQSVGAVSEN